MSWEQSHIVCSNGMREREREREMFVQCREEYKQRRLRRVIPAAESYKEEEKEEKEREKEEGGREGESMCVCWGKGRSELKEGGVGWGKNTKAGKGEMRF